MEEKEGQSLRRSPTDDMEIWARTFLETVFKSALGPGCDSVVESVHATLGSVPRLP